MSVQVGRLRKLGIGKESTKGTAVSPTYYLPYNTFDPAPVVEVKKREGAIGVLEDAFGSDIVGKSSKPTVEGIVTDKAIGLLFLGALGQVASQAKSAPNASVYDHTFTVLQGNSHPALTLAFKDGTFDKAIPYCIMDKLSLEAKAGDYVKFKADFLGHFEESATNTPSITSENVFVPRHITVKIANTVADLGGATAIPLVSTKVDISKNAEQVNGFGSDEPIAIYNKELNIAGDLELVQDGATYRDLFLANTPKAMSITITSDVTIGTSANPALVITFNQVVFDNYKENGNLKDLIKEQIGFSAQYKLADSKSVTVVLTNLATSY